MSPVARVGDMVEIKSAEEILATLDAAACLDGLPFMPEMLQYCGKRFRVAKSAHKTCNTLGGGGILRMANAVHLDAVRCDGGAHGGCQAGCLLFWKTAWLREASPGAGSDAPSPSGADQTTLPLDTERLARNTRDAAEPDRYRCQATELRRATTRGRWFDARLYLQDVVTGNVRLRELLIFGALAAFNLVATLSRGLVPTLPRLATKAGTRTPTAELHLQPGDRVTVRSKQEIMRTLNGDRRNRGLLFDVEMLPYCGKSARVLRRVERLVDERTGRLLTLTRPCLILDGVTCRGNLSEGRMFCPRGIYPYWHEIWLTRDGHGDRRHD